MPNKKTRNPIYFYALEYKQQKNDPSPIRDIIEKVYLEWKSMSEEQKEPYKRKYAEWKSSSKHDLIEILSVASESTFASLDNDPKKLQYEIEQLFEKLQTNVQKINKIKDFDSQLDFVCRNNRWFVIKFQTFCKCDTSPNEGRNYNPYYVLAEVALVEFSLKNGITREYHTFIKPNKIPMGFRSQCMATSRDVHEIPLDNFERAHFKDYVEIYRDIIDFIRANEDEDDTFYHQLPLSVFCMQNDYEETKFGFEYLRDIYQDRYNKTSLRDVSIYRLELLVSKLANQANPNIRITSLAAHDLLTQYTYDYTPEIRCSFHEYEKNNINCSLAIVKKYCFLISDAICPSFNIDLTERHVPKLKSVGTLTKIETRSGFKAEKRSNRTNMYSRRRNYYEVESISNSTTTNFEDDPEDFPDSDLRSNVSGISNNSINSYHGTDTLTTVSSALKANSVSLNSRTTGPSSTRVLVSKKFENSLSDSNRAQKSTISDDSISCTTRTSTLVTTTINTYCSDKNNADLDEDSTSFISNRNNAYSKRDVEAEGYDFYDEEDEFSDNQTIESIKNLNIDSNNNDANDHFTIESDWKLSGHSKKIYLGRGTMLKH